MILTELLNPTDRANVERRFGSWALRLRVKFASKDGLPGGSRAWIPGYYVWLPSAWVEIHLDPHDLQRGDDGLLVLGERALETLYHELYHVLQYRRGIGARLSIVWARLVEGEQLQRWHEAEARKTARGWAEEDRKDKDEEIPVLTRDSIR